MVNRAEVDPQQRQTALINIYLSGRVAIFKQSAKTIRLGGSGAAMII